MTQGSPSLEHDKRLLKLRMRSGMVSTQVANYLRDEIRMGYIEPGTRLRQEEVADRLGVSTTPVREAFRLLQAEGLLALDPRRGVQVAQPTANDVLEYYEIRKILEKLAIAAVIEHATDKEVDDLEPLLARMESIDDEVEWTEINSQFHAALYRLSHRPHLCALISNLSEATAGYTKMVVQRARSLDQARHEHRAILEAVRSRNISAAEDAIFGHLEHTVEEILAFLETVDSHAVASTNQRTVERRWPTSSIPPSLNGRTSDLS